MMIMMTTREFVTKAMELTDDVAMLEKAQAIIESLDKSASRKSTSKSAEYLALESAILEYLTDKDGKTATEIGAELGGLTSQKVAPRLAKLCKDGAIKSKKVKGVTYWSIA